MDEEVQTPTHRRRSSSLFQTTDGQRVSSHSYRPSPQLPSPDDYEEEIADSDLEDARSDEDADDGDEETGLTHPQRRRRRREKRSDGLLDERTAGDRRLLPVQEGKTTRSFLRNNVINALLIVLWYSFSISISVYNKWMFSSENLDFHFPLFTTSLHMLVQFALATTILYLFPSLRPTVSPSTHHNGAHYEQLDGSNAHSKPPAKPLMTRWFYFSRIAPCGTATALDIGLGNFSLRFISLSFFTMCKSSVLGFVLVFAFLFRLERPTWQLCAVILVMTAGVIMMVAGEEAFDAAGFMLVMTASLCSGFRWSLTQILLLRHPATSNPFSSIFFLTPIMFLALFVLAVPIEGPVSVVAAISGLASAYGVALGTLILLFPGALAFLMVAAEFALLKRTSVVTLSVCGIFKEVLTISAAGAVFGDELSPINVSGLFVTIASIAAYNYLKYSKMKTEARGKGREKVVDEDVDAIALETTSERRAHDADADRSHGLGGVDMRIRDSLSLAPEMNGDVANHSRDGTNGPNRPR